MGQLLHKPVQFCVSPPPPHGYSSAQLIWETSESVQRGTQQNSSTHPWTHKPSIFQVIVKPLLAEEWRGVPCTASSIRFHIRLPSIAWLWWGLSKSVSVAAWPGAQKCAALESKSYLIRPSEYSLKGEAGTRSPS